MGDTLRRGLSWSEGMCRSCGSVVLATSAHEADVPADYEYYCANRDCPNSAGIRLYDDEEIPDWIDTTHKRAAT